MPTLKNKGPLLVDKIRGYFDRLPDWLRDVITVRIEKQKVDAKVTDLDPTALQSELKQEVTDEKLRTNTFLGEGEAGSGNDTSGLPTSHLSEIVLTNTGQVANVTETVGATEEHLVEGPPLQDGSSEQVGDLWVKKEVTAPTFDDKVFQLSREDLIPPEFRALVPEKLEAHTVDGEATLPTLASGEILRKEEQKKVGVKTVSTQSRDLTSPPVLSGQRIDPNWNGAVLKLEQKIVPEGTKITQVFGMVDGTVKAIDGVNAVQATWSVDAAPVAFPTIYLRKFDSEIQNEVVTSRTIVPNGAVYTPGAYDLDYQERAIDALHSLREVEVPNGVPASFSTYTTQSITFPGILSYLGFSLVAIADVGRKEPQWVAGIRAGFTAPTNVRVLTEFFTSAPPLVTLYTWAQTDIIFKGVSYSISLNSVLTDTWSNIGVTFSADAYYGNVFDRFSISATTPSASTYAANIGLEAAIACVVDKYKRYWVRRTSIIILR